MSVAEPRPAAPPRSSQPLRRRFGVEGPALSPTTDRLRRLLDSAQTVVVPAGATEQSVAARPNTPEGPGDIAKCPVCLDAFAEPVTLNCNHNICKRHIADLAEHASGTAAAVGPSSPFVVKCPKCRATHQYAGMQSVRVNTEMQALVDAMHRLTRAAARVGHARPRSSTPQQGGDRAPIAAPRHVSFERDAPLSPPHGNPPLATVEARLQQDRAAFLQSRDEEARRKLEAFKKQRAAEIEARILSAQHQPQTSEEQHAEASPAAGAARLAPRGATGGLIALSQSDAPRRTDDAAAQLRRRDAEAWLAGDVERASRGMSEESTALMQRITAYLRRPAPPSEVDEITLSLSQKARVAESRLPLERDLVEHHVAAQVPVDPAPTTTTDDDVEVQQTMLDAERRAQRELEEGLTRAQMADIAEQRAREMVHQFYSREAAKRRGFSPRSGAAEPSATANRVMTSAGIHPAAPTYRPKLERMQVVNPR